MREVSLSLSDFESSDHALLLRAADPLLAQVAAPGGISLVQLSVWSEVGSSLRDAALMAVLSRCKAGLRSLRMRGSKVRLSIQKSEFMATLHSLEHVVLPLRDSFHVSAAVAQAALVALPRLHSLSVDPAGHNPFWTTCIAQMTGLRSLHVHFWLHGMTARQLVSAIAHLHALTRLSLSGHLTLSYADSQDSDSMFQHELPALQRVLASVPEVQHLDLSNLSLFSQTDCTHALCAAVAGAALPALTRLDLCASNMTLGSEDMQPVCAHLAVLTRLRELDLSRNPIRDSGAVRLAPCAANLTILQRLGLSRCDIGPAGVEALAPALRQLAHLARLDFSHNPGVSAECAEHLARELGMRAAGGVLSGLKQPRIERAGTATST